jgi:transcriptional regulator with XRE-family HTH domain
MSVGERILDLRKAAGISQLDISRALDISRQAVSKWENDASSPDVMNLIKLADLLDTDVEYLATGRKSYGRRPPVVIKTTETVEKIVEKPVVQTVETVVEHIVEKPVYKTIEKPVIKKVYRKQYIRNPREYLLVGLLSFVIGLILGLLL